MAMAALFTSPADCGPRNELKSLGNRLDVDRGAIQDRSSQNALAGPSRAALQPFRALPTTKGFNIASPSPSQQRSPKNQGPLSQQQNPAAFHQPPPIPFPAELGHHRQLPTHHQGQGNAWLQQYQQGQRTSKHIGQADQGREWVNGYQAQEQKSRQHQVGRVEQPFATPVQHGGQQPYRPYQHAIPPLPQFHHYNQQPFSPPPIQQHYPPSPISQTQIPQPLSLLQDPSHTSDLSHTARQILSIPALQDELRTENGPDAQVDNPFASSQFFELMKDLAGDGSSEREGAEGVRVGSSGNQSLLDEMAGTLGCLPKQDEQTTTSRVEADPLNVAYAIPSSSQPIFDTQGRWLPHGQASSTQHDGGLSHMEKGWEDAFKEIERGLGGGVDVPRDLEEALARSGRGRVGREEGLREPEQRDEQEQDGEDDFDQEGFAAFYGRTYQPGQTDRHIENSEVADRLQTEISGVSNRAMDQQLWNSDERLDDALAEERQERLRKAGYFQRRMSDCGMGSQSGSGRGQQYQFVRGNPYLQRAVHDPMGDIRGANVLQYQNLLEHEAEVLRDPQSASTWYNLGLRQQENERDDQAIRALLQSISINPSMREAYLALSVSYTNEGNLKSAHEVLEKWVDLFDPNQNKGQDTDAGRFGSSGEDEEVGMTRNQRHEVLTRELMRMARMRPQGDVDADVQVALGVLFNASEEYDKASDCFRTALQVREEDWMLYNRMGATLANGGNSEEALRFYEMALGMNPGYVRAMFNVGISLIKLQRYRQASRYIIDSIRLQQADAMHSGGSRGGKDGAGGIRSVTSESLWRTLETACTHLQRYDLVDCCRGRDINKLDEEFQDYD